LCNVNHVVIFISISHDSRRRLEMKRPALISRMSRGEREEKHAISIISIGVVTDFAVVP
jgi:hypothetical protein